MQPRWGPTRPRWGGIIGAFMLTAGLLSIPAGLLADRIGRKTPLIAGLLAIAGSALLIPYCHLPIEMAGAYILFGAGLAAFAPGMLSAVADLVPAERLGQAYGWYTTAIYIAMTLGPATGGLLAKSLGLSMVFVISGLLTIAVASLALLVLPQSTPRRKSELHSALSATVDLLQNQWLLASLLATVGSCIGFGFFITFLPLYAASLGYDPAQAGLLFAAQALTNVLCRVPIGSIADRFDRRLIVVAGLLCLALALPAMGQAVQLPYLMACAVLLGVGMALAFTAIGALIAEQVPARQRGLAMGMYNSCIYLGMMTGSTLLGLVLKWIGYPIGFAISGGVALLALCWFGVLTRRLRRD